MVRQNPALLARDRVGGYHAKRSRLTVADADAQAGLDWVPQPNTFGIQSVGATLVRASMQPR